MECLLQYLDDIDDMVGAIGLLYEGMRRLLTSLLVLVTCLAAIATGATLALTHPPMAMAISVLLFVTLLYRSITAPSRVALQSA